jgi:AbrB family looped-hinge helix DNA binding protein
MTTATVSAKSQITLPAAACREVGIRPHDRVLVEVREGVIVVRAAPDLMKMRGMLGKAMPRDVERRMMAEYLARRHKASR